MASTNKTAITNVRVFDGLKLTTPTTIVISNDKIVSSDAGDAVQIDGKGGVLLPGFIDAHCHIFKHKELHDLARAGVTTALDMGCFPLKMVNSFRKQSGVTDYYSAGIPLTASGSHHSKLPGMPVEAQVSTADAARTFVRSRVEEGMDYIKLIVDDPGPSQEALNAACEEARKYGKLSIAHAPSFRAVEMAQEAKCDFVTHVTIDKPMTVEGARKMVEEKRGCIPTLTMMEVVHNLGIPGNDYANCEKSVGMMHRAGVPVLAGTDANMVPGSPAHVPHGQSTCRELELLVKAGFSTVEALRAATVETAKHFGFQDRGVIESGKRADLVLIEGDPIEDVTTVRSVQRVWCGGIEVIY
jgi:imidazolonepropionase-like amidohydrolase